MFETLRKDLMLVVVESATFAVASGEMISADMDKAVVASV